MITPEQLQKARDAGLSDDLVLDRIKVRYPDYAERIDKAKGANLSSGSILQSFANRSANQSTINNPPKQELTNQPPQQGVEATGDENKLPKPKGEIPKGPGAAPLEYLGVAGGLARWAMSPDEGEVTTGMKSYLDQGGNPLEL